MNRYVKWVAGRIWSRDVDREDVPSTTPIPKDNIATMPATEQESKKQLAAREALDIINDISNLLVRRVPSPVPPNTSAEYASHAQAAGQSGLAGAERREPRGSSGISFC